MGKILEKVRVTLDKDLDSAYQVVDQKLEKVKVAIDKDLDSAHQVIDKRFEGVRVTLDADFNKFMKRVGFFQR
jgi:hypothetical protein